MAVTLSCTKDFVLGSCALNAFSGNHYSSNNVFNSYFVPSTNRIWTNSDDNTHLIDVLNFTVNPAVLDRQIANPGGYFTNAFIQEPITKTVLAFINTNAGDVVGFFNPTAGFITSLAVPAGGNGRLAAFCIVPGVAQAVLFITTLGSGLVPSVYLIDVVNHVFLQQTIFNSNQGAFGGGAAIAFCASSQKIAIGSGNVQSAGNYTIGLFNKTTLAQTTTLTYATQQPNCIAYATSADQLWVIDQGASPTTLFVVNPAFGNIIQTITAPDGESFYMVLYNPICDVIVANTLDTVYTFDPHTRMMKNAILLPGAGFTEGLTFDPVVGDIYTENQGIPRSVQQIKA